MTRKLKVKMEMKLRQMVKQIILKKTRFLMIQ
jgi:hypothetical protein